MLQPVRTARPTRSERSSTRVPPLVQAFAPPPAVWRSLRVTAVELTANGGYRRGFHAGPPMRADCEMRGFGQPASGAITVAMKGIPAVFVANVA